MAIPYNKGKDRIVLTPGPRDRQLRQQISRPADDSILVAELRSQVLALQDKLLEASTGSSWTDAKVNEEIIKAIKIETANLREELIKANTKISLYEKEIIDLKYKLKNNIDENKLTLLLTEATKKIDNMTSGINCDNISTPPSDRPQMETVVIDPLEGDSTVEKHIEVKEDIHNGEKDKMADKMSKLKNLMGKSPLKK